MRKLKSLIGLSIAATLPMTAGLIATNQNEIKNFGAFNGKNIAISDYKTVKFKDNNPTYFSSQRPAPYAKYSIFNVIKRRTQALYQVYISPAGAHSLAQYATSKVNTGANIMYWFNKYAPGFGSGDYQTGDYLSAIKWSQEDMMGTVWAYKGFKDHAGQASNFLYNYIKNNLTFPVRAVFLYQYINPLPSGRNFKISFGNF